MLLFLGCMLTMREFHKPSQSLTHSTMEVHSERHMEERCFNGARVHNGWNTYTNEQECIIMAHCRDIAALYFTFLSSPFGVATTAGLCLYPSAKQQQKINNANDADGRDTCTGTVYVPFPPSDKCLIYVCKIRSRSSCSTAPGTIRISGYIV